MKSSSFFLFFVMFLLVFTVACSSADSDGNAARVKVSTAVQPGEIKTFVEKSSAEVCVQDGKPVIRLYSTTWCPHCKWIKSSFNKVVQEYVAADKIVARHWVLDINDDDFTSLKESVIPTAEMKIFEQFNPQQSIPTFVFGCKYYRVGNGYEAQDDLVAEEIEFRSVIDKVIAEAGGQ